MEAHAIRSCLSLRFEPDNEDLATALVDYEDNPDRYEWISARLVPQNLLYLHMQHVSDYVIQAGETNDTNMPLTATRADYTGFDGESDADVDDGSSSIYGSQFIAPSCTPSIHPSVGPEDLDDEEEDFAAMCCCKRPTQCECECHTDTRKFKTNKKTLKRVIIDDDDD